MMVIMALKPQKPNLTGEHLLVYLGGNSTTKQDCPVSITVETWGRNYVKWSKSPVVMGQVHIRGHF